MLFNCLNGKCQIKHFAIISTLLCTLACAQTDTMHHFLREPEKWFNLPYVGITEIHPTYDGFTIQNKGTVAYKNRIKFDSLRFTLSIQPDGELPEALLVQFNKPRRDSSINQHHLIDTSNYGYGLLLYKDGRVSLTKHTINGSFETLFTEKTNLDLREPTDIEITRRIIDENNIELALTMNGIDVGKNTQPLDENYPHNGFLSFTIYDSRSEVSVSDMQIVGEEESTDLQQNPRSVYIADFFKEPNRSLIHFAYDDGTSDYTKVLVQKTNGETIAQVPYPVNFWVVPCELKCEKLQLVAVNIDNHKSEPAIVTLKDDHAEYYHQGEVERLVVVPGEPVARLAYASGKPFYVQGLNYVRLRFGEHSNFEAETIHYPADYDPYEVESLFKLIKKTGFNSVRVFIAGRVAHDPGIGGNYETTQGLYAPYMENFIDLLERARKYGIYILPTLCDGELPLNRHYIDMIPAELQNKCTSSRFNSGACNVLYFTKEGIEAKKQNLLDFLHYIAKRDKTLLHSFLAMELRNELYIIGNKWPFNMEEGNFTGADGQTYDMANNNERQMCYDNGLLHYHKIMTETVKSIDPELLVSQGFYTLRIVEKDPEKTYGVRMVGTANPGFPPLATLMGKTDLDMLDMHIYHIRKDEEAETGFYKDMNSSHFFTDEMNELRKTKPVFLGEYGSFKFIAENFETARKDLLLTKSFAQKENMAGHMMWTLDTYEQRILWHAIEGGEPFLKELAPYELTKK